MGLGCPRTSVGSIMSLVPATIVSYCFGPSHSRTFHLRVKADAMPIEAVSTGESGDIPHALAADHPARGSSTPPGSPTNTSSITWSVVEPTQVVSTRQSDDLLIRVSHPAKDLSEVIGVFRAVG
jgi:hypothetical protein